ncbi:MAG: mechanosensitive ion channel family protein [Planctomycetota bacterium]|jgi:small conductance mechanosensitive channel
MRNALLPLLIAFGASFLPAQEAATTVSDPKIALTELGLRIRPLTMAELETEASAWRDLLKAKVTEITAAAIAGTAADALLVERRELSERLTMVLKDWTAKGGDDAEYQAYISSATSDQPPDLSDPSFVLQAAVDWVVSPEGGLRWAFNILKFLVVLLVFKIIAGILGNLTKRATGAFKGTSNLLRDFFVNVVRKLVFFIGLVVALSMIGVDIGPLLAAMGALGFIIAFALQGTLSNFAAGIMILLYRPFELGDVVSVAGETGKVTAMNLVSTTINTADNQSIVVPNGSIWGGVITNITGNDTRRVDLIFGCGYGDDLAKVQKTLEEVVAAHPAVLADPATNIQVHELADSSVNFIVRPWAKTEDYWAVYWDLQRQVKDRFDKEGISIPFPQQDVYMHQASA